MRKNRKGAKRRAVIGKIARTVLLGGANIPVEIARKQAKRIIEKNRKKLEKFVVNEGGEQPAEDTEGLAVQVARVRAKKIEEIKEDPNIDADTTDEAAEVFEEQQADDIENESYTGESDAFTEEAIGAALGIAKGVVNKIKQARYAKGKKFLGKGPGAKLPNVDTDGSGNIVVSGATNPKSKDPLSLAINDAKSGAASTMVKQWLPIIIIAAVVGFFLLKKK